LFAELCFGLQHRFTVRLAVRAAFDRKLKREKPWTQQDIAAEALTLRLKKNGYL
jgi:hypothetical protein